MKRHDRILPAALTALVATLGVAAQNSEAAEIPFGEAKLFFELNNTDGDLGIHALIDGEPWKLLEIEDPAENVILDVLPSGRLGRHGMTELTFESAEPAFDELPPAQFFRRFPEGLYEIEGLTLEGDELEGEVRLSHVMPAPARNVKVNGLAAAKNCDAILPKVSPPVVITWSPVTGSHPTIGKTGPIRVARYQVFTELVTGAESVFSLDLPPGVTRFHVPVELLRQGRDFKFEILVRGVNGNQTAIESCFTLR